jgi:hypothetical protein
VRHLALILAIGLAGCGEPNQNPGLDGWSPLDGQAAEGLRRDGGPPPDGAVDGTPAPDAGPPLSGPARYGQTTHSPITSSVAANLRAIAAAGPAQKEKVFAKVGDSNTVNSGFLHCFAGSSVSWGSHGALAATVTHFKTDLGGGVTPFDRDSLAAVVGWPAHKAIAGSPTPLAQELGAISPRLAVVMFGSNDIGYDNIWQFGGAMLAIADQLIGKGVIPILTTIPPRADSTAANLQVPRYNAVVRGVGQARQVPVIDLHRELVPLPQQGLGSDGLHLNVKGGGCDLTSAGLQYGFNVRNLVTLEALGRVKAALEGAPAPDPATAPLLGAGTAASPYLVDGLPFSDLRNTAGWPEKKVKSYGCAATVDESGPEVVYRLELTKPTTLRALVFDGDDVDIDLHLLDGTGNAATGCLARDDKLIVKALQPGSYHLVLDTYVTGGVEKAGEYLLVLLAD